MGRTLKIGIIFIGLLPLIFTAGFIYTSDSVEPRDVASQLDDRAFEVEKQARERLGIAPPANPWGESQITVAVVDETNTNREFTPLIEQGVGYWNDNLSRLDYEGQFTVTNTSDPDVRVRIVEEIDTCGVHDHTDAVGCAEVNNGVWSADRPTEVRIQRGYADESTKNIVAHEIGHTLGLRHEDAGEWAVMVPERDRATTPQPNATVQANPWASNTISVFYASRTNVSQSEQNKTEAAFDTALEYYSEGADGFVPDDVEIRRTTDREEADIEIAISESVAGGNATATWRGIDEDKDDELETHTHATVLIESSVPPDQRGWYAGYMIGTTFGINDRSDLPPPFRDPDTANKSAWRES
jgi:hypothetical protein